MNLILIARAVMALALGEIAYRTFVREPLRRKLGVEAYGI